MQSIKLRLVLKQRFDRAQGLRLLANILLRFCACGEDRTGETRIATERSTLRVSPHLLALNGGALRAARAVTGKARWEADRKALLLLDRSEDSEDSGERQDGLADLRLYFLRSL